MLKPVTDPTPQCNHTLHHVRNGARCGTWEYQQVANRIAVICRWCHKFYAYLPNEQSERPDPAPLPEFFEDPVLFDEH